MLILRAIHAHNRRCNSDPIYSLRDVASLARSFVILAGWPVASAGCFIAGYGCAWCRRLRRAGGVPRTLVGFLLVVGTVLAVKLVSGHGEGPQPQSPGYPAAGWDRSKASICIPASSGPVSATISHQILAMLIAVQCGFAHRCP